MQKNRVKKSYIDGKYGQLHLRTVGHISEKPALICLHMAPKSGRSFHNVLPYLAKDRLVIAPDYPGYGESDHPPSNLEISVNDYAQSVLEVIKHFDLSKVDLLGYHTGAMVSVSLALQRPELINKLVFISAPIFTLQEITDFQKYFAPVPLDESGERYRLMWERIMYYRGPEMTLQMAAISMAENLRGGEDYETAHRAAFNYAAKFPEDLKTIDQEVFVMNINDDLYEHSRRADRYLNNGFRKDYPDYSYGCLDAKSQEISLEILAFFNRT